jgi:hypothetical protein
LETLIAQAGMSDKDRNYNLELMKFAQPKFETKQAEDGSFIRIPDRGDAIGQPILSPDGTPVYGAMADPWQKAKGDLAVASMGDTLSDPEDKKRNFNEGLALLNSLGSASQTRRMKVPNPGAASMSKYDLFIKKGREAGLTDAEMYEKIQKAEGARR